MSCLIETPEIQELVEKLQGETTQSVLGLVSLWQEKNNRSVEEYPSIEELRDFRQKIRSSNIEEIRDESKDMLAISPYRTSSAESQNKVALSFDPKVRRDRVSLIARLFSKEIDNSLIEMSESLNRRIFIASTEEEKSQLQVELNSLDRFTVISKKTPSKLFWQVQNKFLDYLNDTEEGRIQAEFKKLNAAKGADRYSDEQKLQAAKKRAAYKEQEYRKIVDNFRPLAEEASIILALSEKIRATSKDIIPSDVSLNYDTPEGVSVTDELSEDWSQEEAFKDGWMTKVRQISARESLSQDVRKAIRQIPRLNYKGKYEKDDLGFIRYLDADYVHAALIEKLENMITSEDMIPLLQELSKDKPWVKQVIEVLQKDESLFSQFYQNFRMDFLHYWVQKEHTDSNGVTKIQTIPVNVTEGIRNLLDSWRYNHDEGILLDDHSIYEKNGDINIENAEDGLKWTGSLNNEFNNLSKEDRVTLLEEDKIWNTILKLLRMVGIDANPLILKNALISDKSSDVVKYTDPIIHLLSQLNIIFRGVKKGEMKKEGTETKGDLINTFKSAFSTIAHMIAEVREDAVESSARENDKTYYSYAAPNYLGKLIKQLKNVNKDKKRFKEFIDTEFKQFEWFFKNGEWRSDWLKQIVESDTIRDGLDHKVVLNFNKTDYTDWDALDYTRVLLAEYWGNPEDSRSSIKWAWYHVPILSDASSAEFIRFRKYVSGVEYDENGNKLSYEDIILDKLVDLVSQEYDRIMLVREMDEEHQKGNLSVPFIANYNITRNKDGSIKNIGGAEFKFLPALNNIRYDNGETFLDRLSRLSEDIDGSELRGFIKGALKEIMEEGFEDTYRDWARIGLFEEAENGKYKYLPFTIQPQDKLREALREYYWNSKLATSQIIEITTTDLAFYKNMEDFQKRFKEIYASSLRMNTQATYRGEKIGRDWERTIYLKDDEIKSSIAKDVEEVFLEKYNSGEFSAFDAASIIAKYGLHNIEKNGKKYYKIGDTEIETSYVNVADAQAYRSLSSYRAVLVMSGQWTDTMEKAYNNFRNGTWDASDFNIIWQTKKPYVYTQVNTPSNILGHTGIKTPVQHKNSEFLLLASHELVAGPLGKSGKLRAINEFMEENNIDVIQFESTTKVGKQGVIDINKVNDFQQVKETLKSATKLNGVEDPNKVHKISYEDYGFQTATPEHSIDATQLVGTQVRKIVTANISPDTIIDVNNKKMSRQEWLGLYQAVIAENILQSFIKTNKVFEDPKGIEKILLEEINSNPRYGIEMARACTLNEDGQFNIPPFEPTNSLRIQTLLYGKIKNDITKQKIRGGALIQVSNYGLSDELHIVFEGEGKNKRIKYFECFMPAYSRDFIEPLVNPNTHVLDINKKDSNGDLIFSEELRKAIGYRVPTEDVYSIAPLYIKGFLPMQNGSSIMLPSEITTLSGSDFDVDKLYVMLPEFRIEKYDFRRAKQDFKGEQKIVDALASLFREDSIVDDLAEAPIEFREWFGENKDKYKLETPRIRKIKYNFTKTPQENSLEARNNLIIDMMYGVLTNPDTTSRILNPGGFDYQKRAARITSILLSSTEADLREKLKVSKGSIIDKLLSMSLDDLNELTARTKKKIDPLNPMTQIMFHQQNMTGAKLIGIYANHNANHALMQHTRLKIDDKNGSFVLNGKRLTSLHDIRNKDGEIISKNNAGFLAASVDNVKDPILADLNQNTFTADATMLLSRAGYNPIEIGLLMTQPIILDMTQRYFRKTRGNIVKDVIKEYAIKTGMSSEVSYGDFKNNDFPIEDLANNILVFNRINDINSPQNITNNDELKFYKDQLGVGVLFQRILNTSRALGDLVQATKFDTQNGGAGPTIADTTLKIQRLQDFLDKARADNKFPLIGAEIISDDIFTDLETNELREKLLNSDLPFLQAFYTLGLQSSEKMMGKYFPQFTEPFVKVVTSLREIAKYGRLDNRTLNSIYNDLFVYIMSNTPFFGNERSSNNELVVSSREKRSAYINDFPAEFKKIVAENADIVDNEFIKRLRVVPANSSNPVDTLVFSNVGKLSPTLRERFMNEWEALLYIDNPMGHKLALDLFKYCYYRNGFAFGPSTFIHLAPIAVKKAIPGYINTLRSLVEPNITDDYTNFVAQYIYNHLDNRKLVPEIFGDTSVSFTDESGNPKEEVTFVIDASSTSEDKQIVKEESNTSEGPMYSFFEFIARNNKGDYSYYKLIQDNRNGDNVAVYRRIEPLGFRNNFIEYEYGKDVNEMISVIRRDRKSHNADNIVDPESSALYEAAETMEDNLPYEESYKEYSIDNILNQAYREVYGTSPEKPIIEDENDITAIEPNADFRDENGDIICGTIN